LTTEQPNFINSPYFVGEPGNWHLKAGAPADVEEEFTLFMQDLAGNEPPQRPSVEDILRDLSK